MAIYILGSLFVTIRLHQFLNFRNYLSMTAIFSILSLRQFIYVYNTVTSGDKSVKKFCHYGDYKNDHGFYVIGISQFLPIIIGDTIRESLSDIIITVFYSFVLKMIDFWDRVYLEKIE